MVNQNKSLNYVCIFGGGAIRGISYVGTVKAIEELGLIPNTLAGSSVGAIFAGLLAVGYNAEELKEIFMQVNFELFRDIHFGLGKNFALSKGEIFLDWLRELIERKFYGENFKKSENLPVKFSDLKKNLVIIATDLTNFKCKEFSKFETPNFEIAYAIRISSTMPGLMQPVEEEGALLVDGDLQKSWPIWRLSRHLCQSNDRILELRLEGDYEGRGESTITFANTVYSCITALATDFIIETYGYRDKFDYIKINTGSVVVVNFNLSKEKRKELMDIGYKQTMNYFNFDLKEKKKNILTYYKKTAKYLKKMKDCIVNNKIKQAKNELGNLYTDFYPSRKYIDLKYSEMIDNFKDVFLSNITFIPFLDLYSLKDMNIIKSKLNIIESMFNEKILELENYIISGAIENIECKNA